MREREREGERMKKKRGERKEGRERGRDGEREGGREWKAKSVRGRVDQGGEKRIGAHSIQLIYSLLDQIIMS